MTIIKRERWKEDEVLSLPKGEQDFFDRKSGAIIGKNTFEDDLAKALSAFANSGGGHLIIGVADDGVIDGVPKVVKGSIKLKDWLEQKIPRLLNYPLQDFRVHEVEPSTPTNIPANHVVIVIDIGDSPLAPHQVVNKHLYYYRAGGRSEPAPHFFLELLWGRQNRYPGQKVARAWLDIITAALNHLYYQEEHLNRGSRLWDRFKRSETRLLPFLSNPTISLPNLEQFLEFHPDVAELIDKHGKEAILVSEAMETLFEALIEQRVSLDKVYQEILSPASCEELFQKLSQKGVPSSSEEDITRAVFGSFGIEHNYKILANNIINRSGELTDEIMVAPLWNLHREKLLAILLRQPYCRMDDKINCTRLQLRRTLGDLIALLKEKRRELAIKFGEPYATTVSF
jgi:hypothetical protein